MTRRIGKCIECQQEKDVEERSITLPTGHVATSHDPMCDECYDKLKAALNI